MLRSTAVMALLAAPALAGCMLDRSGLFDETSSGGSAATSVGAGAPGGSGPSTGAAGGAPVPEDCLDGIDNDLDGAVDCDDPDCADQGYGCVPAFDGAIAYVTPVANDASCPAAAPATTLSSCDDCACSEAEGSCSMTLAYYTDDGCQGSSFTPNSPCTTQPDGDRSVKVTALSPSGGSCGNALAPSVSPSLTKVCRPEATGSCQSGGVCLPASNDPCVIVPAGSGCGGDYPVARKRLYPSSLSSCSCSCSAGETTCNPEVQINTSNSCSGLTTVPLDPDPNVCNELGDIEAFGIPPITSTIECLPVGAPVPSTDPQLLCCAS